MLLFLGPFFFFNFWLHWVFVVVHRLLYLWHMDLAVMQLMGP